MPDSQRQSTASTESPEKTAQQLLDKGLIKKGLCLVLGATDTGKTTLIAALTKLLARKNTIGIVDADTGQSHIGPPGAVGWNIIEKTEFDFSKLTCRGISFIGDISPTGHLLQLTEGIFQCTKQTSKASDIVIIDTPGFTRGPAACALWWTVQRILQPDLILSVERNDELKDIIDGLQHFRSKIERIQSPAEIKTKSPQQRQSYRRRQFIQYFQDSQLYNISLKNVSIQNCGRVSYQNLVNRLISLRDKNGTDLRLGLIKKWRKNSDSLAVKAADIDTRRIRCLVIGDVTIEID